MTLLEIGIMFRGYVLVSKEYHPVSQIDRDIRAGMFTAIIGFVQEAFEEQDFEAFNFKRRSILFSTRVVKLPGAPELQEPVFAYAILDRIDKSLQKKLRPILHELLEIFTAQYDLGTLMVSEVSQFVGFHVEFDRLFGNLALKIEDRFRSIF